jgi:hypothetical protein
MTDKTREAFERAEVHLQWLKESAFDEQDLARIVGYERCLREWQAATSEADAEIRRWKARCIAAENGHPQVKEATAEADAKYLPVIERLVENLKHIETAMVNAAKGAGGIEHEILSHTATYARESADLAKPLLEKKEEV